jgi:hypothetical protein
MHTIKDYLLNNYNVPPTGRPSSSISSVSAPSNSREAFRQRSLFTIDDKSVQDARPDMRWFWTGRTSLSYRTSPLIRSSKRLG